LVAQRLVVPFGGHGVYDTEFVTETATVTQVHNTHHLNTR